MNVFLVLPGDPSVIFIKDHLESKDLMEKELAPILEAFQVEDFLVPNGFKRLLRGLYPDVQIPFDEKFGKYIIAKGKYIAINCLYGNIIY